MPTVRIGTRYFCNDCRGSSHSGDTPTEARDKAKAANASY